MGGSRGRLGRRVDEEGRVWQLLESAREEGGDESRVQAEVEMAVEGKGEESERVAEVGSS